MGTPPPDPSALRERLAAVGRSLGEREAGQSEPLSRARERAAALRDLVAEGLEAYHGSVRDAGAPQLEVDLGELRLDEKHVRAVEFELRRGRHRAIVTVKARGDVTLVGPFRSGKTEGPCKSFPFAADDELCKALGDFLESFVEEAATP